MRGDSPKKKLLWSLGVPPASWLGTYLARQCFVAPFYHMVSDESPAHVRHIFRHKSIRQFEEDIEYLARNYRCVGIEEVLARRKAGARLPSRAYFLSFDDGFREMADVVAPILRAKGVKATFFVSTSFIDNRRMSHLEKLSLLMERLRTGVTLAQRREVARILGLPPGEAVDPPNLATAVGYENRSLLDALAECLGVDFSGYLLSRRPYLTQSQIRSLVSQGFGIGAHGEDHSPYWQMSVCDQIRQTRDSVMALRTTFALPYGIISFPHSDRGVAREVFTDRSVREVVDVTFGTGGIHCGGFAGHVSRVSFEVPPYPARHILTVEGLRVLVRRLRGIPAHGSAPGGRARLSPAAASRLAVPAASPRGLRPERALTDDR